MKHTSKRLQALVLVLAMCVSFLQIPSFATDDVTHSNDYSVGKVAIGTDGNFSITEYCSNHNKGDVCNTVKGTIATKKDNTGKTIKDVDKSTKITDLKLETKNVDVATDVVENTAATCAKAGQFTYQVVVTVEGKSTTYTRGPITTDAATGKHTAITEQEAKMDFNALAAAAETEGTFERVSNTATCEKGGKATFAKKCEGCDKFVNTVTVNSPVLNDHAWIQEEKIVDGKPKMVAKEYSEVTKEATCKEAGSERHYVVCKDCGQKMYITANKGKSELVANAADFIIEALPHTYEYTIKTNNPNGNFVTDATNATSLMSAFTVEGKCSVCNATYKPAIVSVKEDTTKLVKADKCKAGSRTFTIVYEAIDYTKEKDKNGDWQTKEVTEEVTVPYYTNNTYAKDSAHDFGTPVTDNETIVKATCTKDGHYDMVKICKVCGKKEVVSTHTLFATGKHTAAAAKKENVVAATTKKGGSYDLVVRCADCGEIISSTHKTTAKIVVKASKVTKATNVKGKKAKITVKKAASVTGYQIQYGTKKNFKGAKSVKTKATTKTVSKLAKKKYYVRVRTYKVVDGKTYYSSWSGAKTVTIKK